MTTAASSVRNSTGRTGRTGRSGWDLAVRVLALLHTLPGLGVIGWAVVIAADGLGDLGGWGGLGLFVAGVAFVGVAPPLVGALIALLARRPGVSRTGLVVTGAWLLLAALASPWLDLSLWWAPMAALDGIALIVVARVAASRDRS